MTDKELCSVAEVGNIAQKIIKEDQNNTKEKVKVILEEISLYFNPGHLVAIMGPSGELYRKCIDTCNMKIGILFPLVFLVFLLTITCM